MKYVLIIEEGLDGDKRVYSTCQAKTFRNLKRAYKMFRRMIKEKISTRHFPFVKEGKQCGSDYFFENFNDEFTNYTEEDKAKAREALDIIYKTVTDENYVFSGNLEFEYEDSEFACFCYGDRVRFTECGMNMSDVISNAHLPKEKGKAYLFFCKTRETYYNNKYLVIRLVPLE